METVKVPQMAESLTEGTLKTWSKQVGDSVAEDEEVATIETDKACFPTCPCLIIWIEYSNTHRLTYP